MIKWRRLFCSVIGVAIYAKSLFAMEFDFKPLSSLCRIEVNLATGFGNGTVRGTFGKLNGKMSFFPENPQQTKGNLVLAARSLRFGYGKVAYQTHAPDWLDSTKYPTITFQLNKLSDFSWHGRELRAEAHGDLTIKGISQNISIPMSINYLRGERRKYEGRSGDLIRLDGVVSIPRSKFGLSPGSYLDSIMEEIDVIVSITGASSQVRRFLPSRIFGY